jgi:hypothetical protein
MNRYHTDKYITVSDLLLETDRIPSIISSEAKGSRELLYMLMEKISNNKITLNDNVNDMINLVNKYISSSQELSRNGRNHFIAIYSGMDMVVLNGQLYHNKVFICDLNWFASIGTMLWTDASLQLFKEDLMNL